MRAKNENNKNRYNDELHKKYAIILIIVVGSLLAFSFISNMTIQAVDQHAYIDTIGQTFGSTGTYIWKPEHYSKGDNLTSIKISGSFNGFGSAKIYVDGNVIAALINLQNNITLTEINITSSIITQSSENETAQASNITQEINANNNIILETNATQPNTEPAAPSQENTIQSTNQNTAESKKAEPIEGTTQKTTEEQSIPVTGNLIISSDKIIIFYKECGTMCSVDMPMKKEHEIRVEVDGAFVTIDNIEYVVKKQQKGIVKNKIEKKEAVSINLSVKNRDSEIETEVELFEEGNNTAAYTGRKLKHNTGLAKGKYRAIIKPLQMPVKEIEVINLTIDENITGIIKLDDVPEADVPVINERPWAEVYAIAPQANFSIAVVTVTSKANTLYKCKEWDFDARRCNGTWTKYKKIVPGENYTIQIDQNDPGFGEINITNSEHLNENYSFVSDIFDQVKARDDLWSEHIPENHYVRATFEINLSIGNVVNIVARAQNGTQTHLELFVANTTNLVGSTKVLSNESSQYDVKLSNFTENDTFDIKIVNTDPEPDMWVEFDFIHDVDSVAPNVTIQNPANTTYNSSTIVLNYTAGDDVALDQCIREWTNETGAAYNKTLANCANDTWAANDGFHTIRVWVNDSSNNINVSITNFTIDTLLPNITFLSPTYASGTNMSRTYTYINVSVNDTNPTSSFVDITNSTGQYGLVGYWNFNNNTKDSSTYGNNGTISGGVSCASDVKGAFGTACSFDGINGHVNAGNSPTLNPTAITISAWVKPSSLTNGYSTIVHRGTGSPYYEFFIKSNGKLAVYLSNPAAVQYDGTGVHTLAVNNWYHIVFTYNSTSGLNAYVNGVLDKAVGANGVLGSVAASVFIGKDAVTAGRLMNGSIDDVRIFNRALTSQEINASYNSGLYRLERNFTNLIDGNYSFYAFTTDTAGNTNRTETRTLLVDTIAPQITIQNPLNITYNLSIITLNYTAGDLNLQSCIRELNGINTTITNCANQSLDESLLGEQSHKIIIWVNDSAGNVNFSVANFTFTHVINGNITLNRTGSPIPHYNQSENVNVSQWSYWDNLTKIGNITTFVWNDSSGNIVRILNFTNNALGYASDNFTTNISSATGVWWVRTILWTTQNGTIKNMVNQTPFNLTNSTDSIPPTITIQNPSNSTIIVSNVSLNYLVGDDVGIRECRISLDNINTSKNPCANQTYDEITLGEGSHTIIVWVNDSSNNVNQSNVSFTFRHTLLLNNTLNRTGNLPQYNQSENINISAVLRWDNITTIQGSAFNVSFRWNNSNGAVVRETNFTPQTAGNVWDNFTLNGSADTGIWWIRTTGFVLQNGTTRTIANTTAFNVTDFIAPTVFIQSPLNTTNSTILIVFNYTSGDNIAVSQCIREWTNETGAVYNKTLANCVNDSFHGKSGSHTLRIWVNDTSNNKAVSSISFTISNFSVTCEAGGPYQQGATVFIHGNVTSSDAGVQSRQVNISIYDSSNRLNVSKSVVTSSDGSYEATFSGTPAGYYTFNSSAGYLGLNNSCGNSFLVGQPASFVLDKTATVYNTSSTLITYNISLILTNKGGSSATSSNITDSDSTDSPYALGSVGSNISTAKNFFKTYTRQDTTTYQELAVAAASGTDSYTNSSITVNSTQLNITIPSTETGKQLVIAKNVVYVSETSLNVTYNVTVTIYNSGSENLTSISYTDSDLSDSTFSRNITKGNSTSLSANIIIDKAASNANRQFALGTASVASLTFNSNRPTIRIPGYGGPADVIVDAPSSVQLSATVTATIDVTNVNTDIGQDFTIDYWITSVDEKTNYTAGQKTIYVGSNSTASTTASLTAPSAAGTYRFKSLVTWAGGTATAFDSFTVQAASSSSSGSVAGGGGSITSVSVITKTNIAPDIPVTFAISESNADELSLSRITVKLSNAVGDAKLLIKAVNSLPTNITSLPYSISDLLRIFKYLEIRIENVHSDSIKEAYLDFIVPKSWVSANNIDKNMVAIYRYESDSWQMLPTTYISEDVDNLYYRSSSSGFSLFAITGMIIEERETSSYEIITGVIETEKLIADVEKRIKLVEALIKHSETDLSNEISMLDDIKSKVENSKILLLKNRVAHANNILSVAINQLSILEHDMAQKTVLLQPPIDFAPAFAIIALCIFTACIFAYIAHYARKHMKSKNSYAVKTSRQKESYYRLDLFPKTYGEQEGSARKKQKKALNLGDVLHALRRKSINHNIEKLRHELNQNYADFASGGKSSSDYEATQKNIRLKIKELRLIVNQQKKHD